jgi:excinuclease UvrABC helicase subunit UvrB
MFDLFGKRKSLKEIMNELDEMIGSFNHEFSSITDEESQSNEGSDKNGEWKTETYTSPNGMFRYVITTTHRTPNKKSPEETDEISLLKKELQDCVERQEFERAVEVRDKIKNFSPQKSVKIINTKNCKVLCIYCCERLRKNHY